MNLTQYEQEIFGDAAPLLAKVSIIKKIWHLLQHTQHKIQDLNAHIAFNFPDELNLTSGKISRGENYQLLPYLVLDCPTFFSKDDIFAYRTMFWWGHFFSFTLHLQGKYLEKYRPSLVKNIDLFDPETTYLSVGPTPWEYHYDPDNYLPISKINSSDVLNFSFVKISRQIDLNRWAEVGSEALAFWRICLDVLDEKVIPSP